MKILLVNPPQDPDIDSNLPSFVNQLRGALPPLGLLYIATQARLEGFDVKVHDCSIEPCVTRTLENYRPDIVGITATTFTLLKALIIARLAKKYGTKTVLGGIHASIYPQETLDNLDDIDYVVTGEGEYAFPELLKNIRDGKAKDKTAVIYNTLIEDLNSLPIPDRTLTDWTKYQCALDGTGYITTVMSSRGCPFGCVFCHRPTMGRRFRARSADNVMQEVDSILKMGIKEITFYDDTFAVDRQRVMNICERIIKEGYRFKWDIRTRVDLVDPEMLKLLKRAGCKQIRYGIEASNNEILKRIGKNISIEQAERAVKWTKDIGIESFTYFIIGSPGETWENWEETIKFSKKLSPDYCYFAIMTPYPCTPLYEDWLNDKNYKRADHWLEFAKCPRTIETPYYQDWIERKQLEATLKRAYKEFYLRPSYLIRRLSKVRSIKELMRGARAVLKIH